MPEELSWKPYPFRSSMTWGSPSRVKGKEGTPCGTFRPQCRWGWPWSTGLVLEPRQEASLHRQGLLSWAGLDFIPASATSPIVNIWTINWISLRLNICIDKLGTKNASFLCLCQWCTVPVLDLLVFTCIPPASLCSTTQAGCGWAGKWESRWENGGCEEDRSHGILSLSLTWWHP